MTKTQTENIVDQLVSVYLNKEPWHKNYLPKNIAERYFTKLYNNGNVLVELDNGKLAGYIEIWSVDFDQMRRILKNKAFHPEEEDISSGTICYISNMYVDEKYRGNGVVRRLKRKAEKLYRRCEAVVLEEHKHDGRYRFFKRRKQNG